MSATKEHHHDQIEAGQRGKLHPIGWLNMPGYKPETWNPIVGCTKASPACNDCFAERMANRLSGMPKTAYYKEVITDGKWNGRTVLAESQLTKPLQWKSPRMVFTVDMGDLFHESVPFVWIDAVFSIMSDNDKHIYVLLTKRPERIVEYYSYKKKINGGIPWKAKDNVWIGVTAENQKKADQRVSTLLTIPAKKRFVSIEPMLGPIDLTIIKYKVRNTQFITDTLDGTTFRKHDTNKLDWVICGGESGPKARPMHPDWVRSVRDQCASANVPFFFKQWGEWQSYWFNMTSKEVCFKMYSSYLQFTQKDWVNKGDACISLDGKLCKTGGDMQQAQYPVAIMQRLGRKNTGNMIDGVRHQNWPKINL